MLSEDFRLYLVELFGNLVYYDSDQTYHCQTLLLVVSSKKYPKEIRVKHKWRPRKFSNFQDPPPPCPSTSKILPPFDLGRPISNEIPPSTNQWKENIIQGWIFMLSGPFFRSAFVFSINSLILSGFSLNSFHLTEGSLSAFSWFYTLVCSCPKISRNSCLSCIIIHTFSTHFAIKLF